MCACSAVQVEGLTKSFGEVSALRGVSFTVAEGEVFGYLGPNGSGKTTTVRIISTLIRPTSGTARVFGLDVQADSLKVRGCIGLVQQAPSFEPYLTVLKNVSLYAYLCGMSRDDARSAAEAMIDKFGLAAHADRKATDLSIGLKRRMQIARELVRRPRLLLLDEPTVGLDPEAKRLTLDLVREMARQGMTVLFTTHNMSEAEYLCDRVAIIDKGEVVVIATPRELLQMSGTTNLEDAYLTLIRRNRDNGDVR
jgi:ABC-2 type transport system ATP-binding protein